MNPPHQPQVCCTIVCARTAFRACRVLAVLPALLGLLLAACGGADRPSGADVATVAEAERYGGTAVVAISGDLPTFNGLAAVDFESMQIHGGLLSMPLFRYDREMRPQPWLAERWDSVRVAPDTLELTIHLRRDVEWHDGVPTTAEDVRFTYERMLDPRVGFPRKGYLEPWSPRVEVLDSFTVRFRLRPHAEFLDLWTWDVILPAHLLREVPPAQLRHHPFGQHPIGNGPFRFVRRVPGQEVVFEANPVFPQALGGRPYLDRVVFRMIPDATARLTELLIAGVDMAFLTPEQVDRVRATRGTRLVEHPHSSWAQILWNTRRPPFDDARVRRALSLAIDRHALVDGVLHGHAEPGRWTATPSHWQYDSADPETEPRYQPAEARRLLAEAGWRDRDGDGILEDAQGRPFRFTLLSAHAGSMHPQSMPVIQAQLRRIGVDMRIRLEAGGGLMAQVQGQLNARGERVRDFDALLTNWETGRSSDDSWFLHSRNRNAPLAVAGYANPRADSLMDTLAATLDREMAHPLWREYQRYMVQESPVTVLYYPRQLVGISDRLQGVEMVVSGPYVTAPRWWILPQERR
jgi:peptide/nickel transport system substrate-binding protein